MFFCSDFTRRGERFECLSENEIFSGGRENIYTKIVNHASFTTSWAEHCEHKRVKIYAWIYVGEVSSLWYYFVCMIIQEYFVSSRSAHGIWKTNHVNAIWHQAFKESLTDYSDDKVKYFVHIQFVYDEFRYQSKHNWTTLGACTPASLTENSEIFIYKTFCWTLGWNEFIIISLHGMCSSCYFYDTIFLHSLEAARWITVDNKFSGNFRR